MSESSIRTAQAEELEKWATAECKFGGLHYCPNCDNSLQPPVKALLAGAAALRARTDATCTTCQHFDSAMAGSSWKHGWCQRNGWSCPAQPFGCSQHDPLPSPPTPAQEEKKR